MKHVLCFGDSNTWGFIPGTCKRYDEHTRWTGVLQDELGADWRIHENGQNGRTTVFPSPAKGFMTGLGALPYALDTLRPLDAIIIMLGEGAFRAGEYRWAGLPDSHDSDVRPAVPRERAAVRG